MPGKKRSTGRRTRVQDSRERALARGRESPPMRELVEFETAVEGSTGEPLGESGTLPGSIGGATGTAGRTPGIQTPGATAPGFAGMSPEEAKRLRRRGRAGGGRRE